MLAIYRNGTSCQCLMNESTRTRRNQCRLATPVDSTSLSSNQRGTQHLWPAALNGLWFADAPLRNCSFKLAYLRQCGHTPERLTTSQHIRSCPNKFIDVSVYHLLSEVGDENRRRLRWHGGTCLNIFLGGQLPGRFEILLKCVKTHQNVLLS